MINRSDLGKTDRARVRIVMEQSPEWNSSRYITFVDYEKAFDGVDRETLSKLSHHYGIRTDLVSLIME